MGNDEDAHRRGLSGRRGKRWRPGPRRGPDKRQTWMQRSAESGAVEDGLWRTPTWRAKCRIMGFGRPLRFEQWGAHGDLSPTVLRPISSRDLNWKQQTTQGTRGLY